MQKRRDSLVFFSTTHTYFRNGREVQSVTEILERVGIIDLSNVPIDRLERARAFGDAVHYLCELDDLGKKEELDEALAHDPNNIALIPYLEAYREFKKDHVAHFLEIELLVHSQFGFAGKLDRLYVNKKGKICLLDIKTSAELNGPYVALQTAGYEIGLKHTHKVKVHERQGLLLRGDKSYVLEKYKSRSDRDYFMSALQVANYKKYHNVKFKPVLVN